MDSLTITEYAHNRKMISLTGLLVREFNSALYFTNIERKEKVLVEFFLNFFFQYSYPQSDSGIIHTRA